MKLAKLMLILSDVRNIAKMEFADFSDIHKTSRAVTMRNGDAVTEQNVTEFIRDRTEGWRNAWIIGQLDEAIAELRAELRHQFQPVAEGSQECAVCRRGCKHDIHGQHAHG